MIFKRLSLSPIASVITLTAFLIMCKLGFWQLDRAEHKRQQIEMFSHKEQVSTQTLMTHKQDSLIQLHGRNVELTGDIDNSKTWLLDNQTHQGKVGYRVITPLTLNDSNRRVLVNWGWIQASQYRSELPQVKLPKTVKLTGIIRSQDFQQFTLQEGVGEAGWPKRIQSIASILQTLNIDETLPILIYADTHDSINYPQTYKPVVMPPEKHQAYAVQWFLLALASIVVFVMASLNSYKKHK